MRFVSLCPFVRAAAAVHTVRRGSESHGRAVNHGPQTDSCVVLGGGEYSDVWDESDTFWGGLLRSVKEGFLEGCLMRKVADLLVILKGPFTYVYMKKQENTAFTPSPCLKLLRQGFLPNYL